MKRTITTAIFTTIAALGFAAEQNVAKTLSDLSLDRNASRKVETTAQKPGFTYFRFAAGESTPTSSVQIVPGLGIGYRMMVGNGAIDVSANYSSAKGWKGESDSFFWTLPKASYIHYWNMESDQTAYAGIGLAWGALTTKDDREFEGVVPNATVGYEFFRKSTFRTFAELNVSQPAIARTVSDAFPGPMAEFSIGAGF
ncbi:MAG TPA: hypothetical protein VLE95_00285 [Chlamydiales bacterium]|nr:hypothetical protein [Chlamydiales bacterium]